MKTFLFVNNFNKSGKSFLSFLVAEKISENQKKVLLVNLSPGSKTFLISEFNKSKSFLKSNMAYLIRIRNNFHYLFFDSSLRKDTQLSGFIDKNWDLLTKKYDYIIFDCNNFNNNFNYAIAKYVNVIEYIIDTNNYSLNKMTKDIIDIKKYGKFDFRFIINKYNCSDQISIEIMSNLLSITKKENISIFPKIEDLNLEKFNLLPDGQIEIDELINRLLN